MNANIMEAYIFHKMKHHLMTIEGLIRFNFIEIILVKIGCYQKSNLYMNDGFKNPQIK